MRSERTQLEELDQRLQEIVRLAGTVLAAHHEVTGVPVAEPVPGSGTLPDRHPSAARKISVSMPEDLTAAVQLRAGRGKFSQYVTRAVARQLELDSLADLSDLLAAEHGPVPEEYLAEAQAAWPDEK